MMMMTFLLQLIVNLVDMNDNVPMFPLSQYIVQGIAETVAVGTDIIQGQSSRSQGQTPVTFSVSPPLSLHFIYCVVVNVIIFIMRLILQSLIIKR